MNRRNFLGRFLGPALGFTAVPAVAALPAPNPPEPQRFTGTLKVIADIHCEAASGCLTFAGTHTVLRFKDGVLVGPEA